MFRLSSKSVYLNHRPSGVHRCAVDIAQRFFSSNEPAKLPTHAEVCIVGGGVIGCSVAYHLAKLGWKDIVLLERSQLSSGTTWHAAGLIGQLRDTETETKLSGVYGTKLLQDLEAETGLSTGFKACGSLTLASSADRLTQLKIRAAKAKSFGIESDIISPREAKELFPYLHTDDLLAALWLPGDGSAVSSDVTQALARGARMHSDGGVRIVENCRVNGISTSSASHSDTNRRVTGVHTDQGDIRCRVVVNCAGLWARRVGEMCGVSVPLASAEHFYIYSRPFQPDPVPTTLPILRDPNAYIYYREWSGGLLMGGFEPTAKPAFNTPTGPPEDFSFSLLPEDWDHFEVLMNGALHRTPCLGDAQVKMLNGPESFTPDNQYILGEAPEVKGFYVAAGFNSSGIASSGGAGKALAEWIVNDGPTMDLWSVDIRRFSSRVHNNDSFLSSRVAETLGLHYQITWPKRELVTGRGLRRSALYEFHRRGGACFGSKFGWERVNFFPSSNDKSSAPSIASVDVSDSATGSPAGTSMEPYSYGRQWWFEAVGAEHRACREQVALFDITSFSKLLIQGPHALDLLQELCVNDMDVSVGKLVYTTMCNERGGIESDLTFVRLAEDKFMAITATAQATRDIDWMSRHIGKDGTGNHRFVTLTDVTSSENVLSLMGPMARQLLQAVSGSDLSHESFPFGWSRDIGVGLVNVRAHRISYVGELGYELYVPSESAALLYETLHAAARAHDIPLTNAGYFSIDSLRLEKGYRAWGHDITPNETPLEAGLSFAVAWDKSTDFIGKEALLEQRRTGVSRRLVCVQFESDAEGDAHPYPYGGEPLFRDGQLVGYLTSAGFGYSLQRALGLAYVSASKGGEKDASTGPVVVDAKFVREGEYEVQIADQRHKVSVSLRPFFDPKGTKMMC